MPDVLENPTISISSTAPSTGTGDEPIVVTEDRRAAPEGTTTTDDAQTQATTDGEAAPAAEEAATGETQDATESATEATDEDVQEEQRVTRKPWFQKRIDTLTTLRRQAERSAQAERDRAQALENELREIQAAQAAATTDDPAPKRDAFEDPDAYQAALAAHAARAEIRKADAQRAKEAAEATRKQREENATRQIAEMHEAHARRCKEATATRLPDFEQVVNGNESVSLSFATFATIERSDVGPDMLYRIAKKPELGAKLDAALAQGPDAFYREFIAQESAVKADLRPKPTKAPKPITPVRGAASPQGKNPEEMTMDEYYASVQPQIQGTRTVLRTR